jgi:hypothetical protein
MPTTLKNPIDHYLGSWIEMTGLISPGCTKNAANSSVATGFSAEINYV